MNARADLGDARARSYLDALLVRLSGREAEALAPAIAQVARVTMVMAILGAIVLLLTAAAQTA